MAITHNTVTRNALADLVGDSVDAGTGATTGKLVVMTSADGTVATLPMSIPAFGPAVSGVITADAITSDTNAVGGTAALFKVVDLSGVEVFRGTVGTSGADLNLSSLAIAAGDTVSVSSFVYTASV